MFRFVQLPMLGAQLQCMMCGEYFVEVVTGEGLKRVRKDGRLFRIVHLCSERCFSHVHTKNQEKYLAPTDDYDQWG